MPKENGIRIDPERGVNPRMTTCTQCGAETSQLALLGTSDPELRCPKCEVSVLGTKGERKCPKCKQYTLVYVRRLGEYERIPMGLCTTCEEGRKKADEAVRAGGIYWKCDSCGSEGAIRAGHPLAEDVRKLKNIAPPNPVGIMFHGEQCPVCGPHPVDPQENPVTTNEPDGLT